MGTVLLIARGVAGMLLRLALLVLSADLIYLYWAGAWYDPNRVIEVSELVVLSVLCVAGLVWTILRYLQLCRDYRALRVSRSSVAGASLGSRWRSLYARTHGASGTSA